MRVPVCSLAAGLFLAGSAAAAGFTPTGTAVWATGPFTVTTIAGSLSCTAKWKYVINNNGKGKITVAQFNGSPACNTITPNLNWIGKPFSATGFAFTIDFNAPVGPCGPGSGPYSLSSTGVITFSYATSGCTVSGTLNTVPTMGITWP